MLLTYLSDLASVVKSSSFPPAEYFEVLWSGGGKDLDDDIKDIFNWVEEWDLLLKECTIYLLSLAPEASKHHMIRDYLPLSPLAA